jgi:hypothetical protein
MGRKRFTPEDIIGHLRTVEIESGKGCPSRTPVGFLFHGNTLAHLGLKCCTWS